MKQLANQEEDFQAKLNEVNSMHDEEYERLSSDLVEKENDMAQCL